MHVLIYHYICDLIHIHLHHSNPLHTSVYTIMYYSTIIHNNIIIHDMYYRLNAIVAWLYSYTYMLVKYLYRTLKI